EEGFIEAGRIAALNDGSELKQYQFIDESPAQNAYYRVKAVDKDGRYRYSQTIRIAGNIAGGKLTVFNGNGNVQYEVFSTTAGDMQVKVADMTGNIIYHKTLYTQPGINRYTLDNMAPNARGLYFLHILTRDGVTYTSKFLK